MHRFYTRSPIAKIVWGILSSLVGIIVLLMVLVSENPRMEAQTVNWQGRSIENGAILFANNCLICHGPNGQGLLGKGPGLNSYYFFTDTGRISDVEWPGRARRLCETNYRRRSSQQVGQPVARGHAYLGRGVWRAVTR